MAAVDTAAGPLGTSGDPVLGDGEPGSSCEIRYLDVIRRGRQAGLSPPMAQEPLLPLHRLDPEMMLAAEQQQILHRVDVVRQRRSFRPRPLAADAHDVSALREGHRLLSGCDLIRDRVRALGESTLVAGEGK